MNDGFLNAFLHSENKFITILEYGQSREVFTDEEVFELYRRYKDPVIKKNPLIHLRRICQYKDLYTTRGDHTFLFARNSPGFIMESLTFQDTPHS